MKIIFSAIIILINFNVPIAFSQQVDFINSYSSVLNRHYATINDMVTTSDSSLLITGASWYHNGVEDYFIIKTDLDGNIKKIIRDDSTSMGNGEGQIIKELSNGNYLMVDFPTWQSYYNFPKLFFYDSTGNFLFQKTPYIPPDITPPIDSVFRPSALVELNSKLYLVGQVYCSSSNFSSGIFIKTDLDGNLLQLTWLPEFVAPEYHGGVITSLGNILIGGTSSDSILINRVPQLTCIDTTGSILWQQTYAIGTSSSAVDEICEIPEGYLLGINDASTLVKVDTTGFLIWAEFQSGFWNEQIHLNYAGNYIMTGYWGTVKWCDTLGQNIADYSASVASLEVVETIIFNDKLFIAGKSYVGSGYDGYLIRISDSLLTSIRKDRLPHNKIYPNPARSGSKLYFSTPFEKIKSVTIHSVDGKIYIAELFVQFETSPFIEIPLTLSAGNYLITFHEANTKSMYRLIVLN